MQMGRLLKLPDLAALSELGPDTASSGRMCCQNKKDEYPGRSRPERWRIFWALTG